MNSNPSRAAILTALASLGLGLVTPAQAEPGRWPPTYFQAGIGFGVAETAVSGTTESTSSLMAGFRFNQYVGVQVIGFQMNSTSDRPSTPSAPVYDFDRFGGAQIVGYIPCTSYWDIFGEIGGGLSRFISTTPGHPPEDKGDGLTGAGIRWQVSDHIAVSLDITRLWDARVTHGSLRAELNF